MRVAILFQESDAPWRGHYELYGKDRSQAQTNSEILEAQGFPPLFGVLWSLTLSVGLIVYRRMN